MACGVEPRALHRDMMALQIARIKIEPAREIVAAAVDAAQQQ
jgi:hypothetical protein